VQPGRTGALIGAHESRDFGPELLCTTVVHTYGPTTQERPPRRMISGGAQSWAEFKARSRCQA
jgi:hypothetical protein